MNDCLYLSSPNGTELVFIDHQLSRLSPNPGLDLSFFLSTSTEPALRHKVGLDSILSYYHSSLLSSLQSLGYGDADAIYSLPQLKEDFKSAHAVGYVLGASHIQVVLNCFLPILPYYSYKFSTNLLLAPLHRRGRQQ